jgi:tetratricopeptide (TPR) repeat protein
MYYLLRWVFSLERSMTTESAKPAASREKRKATYLPRLMPAGAAFILLMILVSVLRDERAERAAAPVVEPPLSMAVYATEFARLDSLANEGLRLFGRREYERAGRFLAEAHFHWAVMTREGRAERYPEDLRFYLGLAHFYRGRPAQGAPLIEEEGRENPFEGKYPWYLAHAYLALGRKDEARAELERVVAIGDAFAGEALRELDRLREPAPPEDAR